MARLRVRELDAVVLRVPEAGELPALIERIARNWAELHVADSVLASDVVAALPSMSISYGDELRHRSGATAPKRGRSASEIKLLRAAMRKSAS